MKTVFRSLAEAKDNFGPCALAIGNFDGVHVGHRTLIHHTVQIARRLGWNTGVLTFHPHPTVLVAPSRTPRMLFPLQERLRLLEEAGAEKILVLEFNAAVSEMTPEAFLRTVVAGTLEARAVVVGQNFRFGSKQAGNTESIARLAPELGFEAHFLAPVSYRGEVVSSSAIRQYLTAGRVERAGRLLGRCFFLEGDVVSGHGIGSRQTVPTLNLQPAHEMIPANGVYITETEDLEDGRKWQSITNVGIRPTFGDNDLSIETFLLSPFDGINPDRIRISFRHKLREERKFPDAQALRGQILSDVARASAYWRRLHRFHSLAAEHR